MGLSANSTVMLSKVTEFITCFLNEILIVRVLQHLYTSMKTHTHQYRQTNNERKKGQESNLVYLLVREAFFLLFLLIGMIWMDASPLFLQTSVCVCKYVCVYFFIFPPY